MELKILYNNGVVERYDITDKDTVKTIILLKEDIFHTIQNNTGGCFRIKLEYNKEIFINLNQISNIEFIENK